jgi:enediyne biosynthesis protein E4
MKNNLCAKHKLSARLSASSSGSREGFYLAQRILIAAITCCCLNSIFGEPQTKSSIDLVDVSSETGISFKHTDGSAGRYYIMETVSAGLALFDYDNDGDEDIYFLNGAPLQGSKVKTPPRNALYRNDGNWKFTDVTRTAGIGDTGYGLGVAAGDYDGDGDLDLYLNNYGPNRLYRNNGDGSFSDVTQAAQVGAGSRVGAGVCFLDMDKDGDLDIYVANYLVFSYDSAAHSTDQGIPVYAVPRRYPPDADILYRNDGAGVFTDVSHESGIGGRHGWGMGIVCADYDNDGDTDIFIGNDVAENFLFQNDGSGTFSEVGLITGAAYDFHGEEQASMGADCGDFNNDGWLDFYVTSYQAEFATLYQNSDAGFFEDVTLMTGAGAGTLPHVTWGNGLVDFDNDGDRDIFVACGHLQVNIERYDDSSAYQAKNVLLMNDGRGKFVNISDRAGNGLKVKLSSRGAAFDDLDNDGDIDAVILNSRSEPTILKNNSTNDHHWLQIRLHGTNGNTFGVGARVKVVARDLTQFDEVHSGRSYQSHYGTRLHFGLGKRVKIDYIEVRWLGGGIDVIRNPGIDRLISITQSKP